MCPRRDRTANLLMIGDTRGPLSYQDSDGHLRGSSAYMFDVSESDYILIIMNVVYDFRNARAWIYY